MKTTICSEKKTGKSKRNKRRSNIKWSVRKEPGGNNTSGGFSKELLGHTIPYHTTLFRQPTPSRVKGQGEA
jgi:hypothetical protein